jgi:3-oxoacyl-[acyl-carrier-protein] synthase II
MTGGPVVSITGMGAITAYGEGVNALSEGWFSGRCAIEDGLGALPPIEPTEHMTRKEARRLDVFAQIALICADEALGQAGWHDEVPVDRSRVACIVGTGAGPTQTMKNAWSDYHQRDHHISPLLTVMAMANSVSAGISMHYGFGGEGYAVMAGCAAGSQALGAAMRMLQRYEVDAVVAGGSESGAPGWMQEAFAKIGALSPSGIARPFDRNRDGFVLGEGAGILVLERREDVERRGGRVLADLLGYGGSSDAFHITAPEPNGAGAARAIRSALADAGVEPGDIDYVNAHGTSTEYNDPTETRAIKTVFGDHAYEIPMSTVKSSIGHLIGAAGAVEAIATVVSLNERVAPPTVHHEEPDEGLDLNYVPRASAPLEVRNGHPPTAISNSFGFGGHNAVLVLRAPA